MKRLLFLLLTLNFLHILKAQELNFFKPDNLKQLPSSECYNIMQDSRGYIWFSTEAGLCKYNGNTIKVFGAADGLPEGATYNVWEDKTGKIWMTTSKNRILYYEHDADRLVEAPFSKVCEEFYRKNLLQVYMVHVTPDNLFWFCTQGTTSQINYNTNVVSHFSSKDSSYLNFRLESGKLIPVKSAASANKLTKLLKDGILEITIREKNRAYKLEAKYKYPATEPRVLTASNKKGEHFIGFGKLLVKINKDKSFSTVQMQHPVLNLYVDSDDDIWIATFKGGVFHFPSNGQAPVNSLRDLSVTGIYKDNENGIWCTTLEKGVFYCRNKYVLNYSNITGLDKRASFLKCIDGNIFLSSETKDLLEIHNDSIKIHSVYNNTSLGYSDILKKNGNFFIANKGYVAITDRNFVLKNIFSYSATQLVLVKEKIYGISYGTLIEIGRNSSRVVISHLPSPGNCLQFSGREGLLIGCRNGLYRVDTTTFQQKKIGAIAGSITRIIETNDKVVWVTTKDAGIYTITNGIVKKISDELGLFNYRFSDIIEDKNGELWIATNAGLIQLKKPFSKYTIRLYNSSHGLNSDEVFNVASNGNLIFASTYEGLCSFPLNCNMSNSHTPFIYVSKATNSGQSFNFSGKEIFDHTKNNIRITYDVLTYRQPNAPVRLFYRISGADMNGYFTSGHELLLNNLSPGNYTVTTYGVNTDNLMSAQPSVVSFEIKKPLWQTPLFIIGIILLLIAIVFFMVNTIINNIQKKANEKTRVNKLLAEYQMSALRAQMNPHFIFNCINSIQRYVLTNKPEEAYNYLAKFSKLIRLVLNYAEENLISLAQEIEILQLYTGLEQLRFENKFSFDIEVDDNVDENEIMVPVMITQPYIENAIWHGLMNLDKGVHGKIKVQIAREAGLLKIVIEDNGIGLKQAALLSKKGHKSKGTNINSRRAEILNIMSSSEKGKVTIEEIISENGKTEGTRVTIYIPQTNNLDYD
ncbi:MAG: histidine kinase [Bacteroidia bacterium]